MKIISNGGFHLTYCTNIHPGESWEEVFANLKLYLPVLKTRLSPNHPFGIGLRLADLATQELLQKDNLMQFRTWLDRQSLYVFTLNGFPYGGFHRQVVKDQVYAPDWSKPERVDYTLRLAKILAALLPEGMDGGISTVPLSYKPWWIKDQVACELVRKSSSRNLAFVAAQMACIREETGKILHVDLEPEPDGLIENTSETIHFFYQWLLPIGGAYLSEVMHISQESAECVLREHVRLCYDTCHFAVEYEKPESVFAQLQAAGIQIGKVQLSAALQVRLPNEAQGKQVVVERLRPFAESTYLHQVIERWRDDTLHHYLDLATALLNFEQSKAQEWRIHFHVPIFIRDYQILQSTQKDIITVLKLLQENHACKHLEIETYTWEVLPPQMKINLLVCIQREYEWVLAQLPQW
jgi:hypothetical protein